MAVTGVGLVTPMGISLDAVWAACLEGRSGVAELASYDASTFPVRIGGEVTDFNPRQYIDRKSIKLMRRSVQFGVTATTLAWEDASLAVGEVDPVRVGVYIGAGGGKMTDTEDFFPAVAETLGPDGQVDIKAFGEIGLEKINPLWLLTVLPNNVLSFTSIALNAQGPNMNIVNAGVSGGQSVGEAAKSIETGRCIVAIAGAYDSLIHGKEMLDYWRLGLLALSNDDPHRRGTVAAEGAGAIILEEWEHARARGARIYGELVGYGCATADAGLIELRSDGAEVAQAIREALADAGRQPEDVGYINAHGNATVASDATEAAGIKRALGSHAARVPVSSTKSMMGHTMAASGTIEAVLTLASLRDQIVPATLNYTEPDPACDIDVVAEDARPHSFELALSISRGVGGHCVVLALAAPEDG
ncbi:MAG: beta-ketoacyl-[acyl-carrier-protein] synthase family protein [Nitrospinota bacterium]